MLTYIKKAFIEPREIHTGRNMKGSQYFYLFLLMVISLTFLSFLQFLPIFQGFQNDINKIKDTIPTFELVDNHLESDEESFLHITDSVALYFDPEDKMSSQMINRESATYQAPISIGILDDQLYLNLLGVEQSFIYADSSAFDTELLKNLMNSFGTFSVEMILFFFLILFLFNAILYIYQLLAITIFTNLIRVFQNTSLNFIETAKITILATYIPFTITYILNAFQFRIAYQFEIIFVSSIIIFYMSLKDMKEE